MIALLWTAAFASLAGALAAGSSGATHAAPAGDAAPVLSLDRVLAAADAHHPSIAMALAEQAAARGELMVSEGAFDPLLRASGSGDISYYRSANADVGLEVPTGLWGTTFTGGWRLGLGDYPIYDGKLETNDWGEVRVGLLIPLLRDGAIDRRRAGIERGGLEQQVQEQAVRLARLEILRLAGLAYWEWAAASARLKVAEDVLELAETREAQLRSRARDGDTAPIEVDDNARLVAQRRARVASAVRSLERAALDLSLFLRAEDGRPVRMTRERAPDVLVAPAATAKASVVDVQEALARRPEVARLGLLRRQVAIDQRAGENQLLPGLSLRAGVSQDLGPSSPPLRQSSSIWAPDPATRAPLDIEIGVAMDLPIPLRQARGRLAVTSAQLRRIEESSRLLEDRVAVDVEDAHSAIRAAQTRVGAADAEVAAARAVEDAERRRYQEGDSTLLFVNLREGATADARLAAVDAGLEARRADILLRAATAQILGD